MAINSSAMRQVIFELALVSVAVNVLVHALAVRFAFFPLSIIFISVDRSISASSVTFSHAVFSLVLAPIVIIIRSFAITLSLPEFANIAVCIIINHLLGLTLVVRHFCARAEEQKQAQKVCLVPCKVSGDERAILSLEN